jgi:uncharacterized MAPEG superfamily protein
MVAMMAGADPGRLSVLVWVYAIGRIIHAGLYYAIATEKNPSPRSYAFIVAMLAKLVLLYDVGVALIS